MYYNREFLNSSKFEASTTDAIESPVTPTELSDWLSLGNPADSLLPIMLAGATEAVTRYIGLNLINRNYVAVWWDYPVYGTMTSPSLSDQVGEFKNLFQLPYANLVAVSSVEVYGTATTFFTERSDAIVIKDDELAFINPESDSPAVKVSYTAGYGATASSVPADIKQAITQAAAFNYEHRGACSASNALQQSGAADMLLAYRKGELFV